MIICFSGTGNTRFVADCIADELGDCVFDLNAAIKRGETLDLTSEKTFVFAFPIYAWNIPEPVREALESAQLAGNKRVCFVVTMGKNSGDCSTYCKKIAQSKGWEFGGFRGIVMPDNYLPLSTMPTPEQAAPQIAAAATKAKSIAKDIAAGTLLEKDDETKFAKFMSGSVNRFFCKHTSSDNFVVSDSCTGCGLCEKLCPMNNVVIEAGKPIFGDKCINCYSCIHHCSVEAIEIKGKSEGKGRYLCPSYTAWSKSN